MIRAPVIGLSVALGLCWAIEAGDARADTRVRGRVFARQTLSKASDPDLPDAPLLWEQEVAGARASVEYRRGRRVKAVLEAEFAGGGADLKDAYIRWRPERQLSLQFGRFKRPMSAVQLAGLWGLPAIERGVLSDLTFTEVSLPIGGRGDGVQVSYAPARVPMVVHAAVFQSRLGTVIDLNEATPADGYLRFEFAVTPEVKVGSTLAWVGYLEKPERQEGFRHAPLAGFDATVSSGKFRLWLDGFVGIDVLPFAIDVSTLDLPCTTGEDSEGNPITICPPTERIADRGLMLASRAIASWRVRETGWFRWLEPFAAASVIDLNARFANDEVVELGAGCAAGLARRLRLQLQLQKSWTGADAPGPDVTWFALQLGAAF